MMDALFWVAVGAFVGWNIPQPFWAKWVQNKFSSAAKDVVNQVNDSK
jgi:hypothetical protein